ncbi:MAG TPA: DUF6298 domain-containing protein, partial [Chitinophaga sp.]|nr:DUF6298 domain-containing protein [Chitinophaga sp.]
MRNSVVVILLFACCFPLFTRAQVTVKNGRLLYEQDGRGNRIPDFSYCGYMAGEQPLPVAPVRIRVPLAKGDATARIQAAINQVAALPLGKDRIKGAVLLDKGTYEIQGSLFINASGVVLRGSGDSTILLGAGYNRDNLVRIGGRNDKQLVVPVTITDAYVPVNAMVLHVPAAHTLKAGDEVQITRPSTRNWIQLLGTDHFGGDITALGWKAGQRDIQWQRRITAVNGTAITLDAPLTTALDTTYGGGTIAAYQWPGRIVQSGVENLRCVSAYDAANPKDEDHRWTAISIENAADAWVRQVTFEHFAGSAVAVLETARRVTVEDCISLAPVSEIGGQRRYTFFTSGQQILFQRLYAQQGYHDFATGSCAAGPNAFVQCESDLPFSFSGAIDSWASGLLLDNVTVNAQALGFPNRGQDGQGAGWTAANSVLWQCAAARIDCPRPPGANNWAYGAWAQFSGDGSWYSSNEYIQPRSLYYAQLAERIGEKALERAHLMPDLGDASSSPSAETAAKLSAASKEPAVTLYEWIRNASQREPIPVNTNAATVT